MKPRILIHGGAGTILKENMTPELEQAYRDALIQSIEAGDAILSSGGTALDAVCAAVVVMEDSELFNAGKGAVFNSQGKHEMDASVMNGIDLEAGAVCGIKTVKNPIMMARDILFNSPHVILAGNGAQDYADERKIKQVDPSYFHTDFRHQQFLRVKDSDKIELDHSHKKGKVDKYGTVGAVAVDSAGNLAAATSTGGMTNKRFGRVGDSPVIGAGTYANNHTCAVSCTGDGEYFIRGMAAYDVSALMEYKGMTLQEACDKVIHDKMVDLGGEGGLIAIDAQGNLAFPFNTAGMYRAFKKGDGPIETGIYAI